MREYIEGLHRIITRYGHWNQLVMMIEEMSELTKELCKNYRGVENKQEITEEIADVLVMIDQLKIMYDISDMHIDYIKMQKVKRTLERIEGEE